MSVDEVAGAVRSGKSLDDLAAEKGVTHEDLVAALKKGAPSDVPGGELDAFAEKVATMKGGARPMGGPPAGPPPGGMPPRGDMGSSAAQDNENSLLDSLAELLETTTAELTDALSSGTSLVDLLRDKGVDATDLGWAHAGLIVDLRV